MTALILLQALAVPSIAPIFRPEHWAVHVCRWRNARLRKGSATLALANERIPEGLVPLASYVQNLSELRFPVQVV